MMTVATTFLIALALAVDAFAVALAAGAALKHINLRHTFRLAWHFGFFQAGMTIIGWSAGLSFRVFIEQFDHWVAFALLLFVGGRMVVGAVRPEKEKGTPADPSRGLILVILSFATSIDALAVGLSFSMLNISIWTPAVVIGMIAGILTISGLYLGSYIGSRSGLGAKVEIVGGLVLIGIGIKILFEHGVFQ